jgi:glycosyltransferase involved in cell wall biosynthesis
VGRLDEGKNIYVLLEAFRAALQKGENLFLLAAGVGPAAEQIKETLSGHAAVPGFLSPEELAVAYASADWLALPSQVETWSMAAAESLASGCPVMAAAQSGTGRFVTAQGAGLMVGENTAAAWEEALHAAARLKSDRGLRARARAAAFQQFSGWQQALDEDFLPVWKQVAGW